MRGGSGDGASEIGEPSLVVGPEHGLPVEERQQWAGERLLHGDPRAPVIQGFQHVPVDGPIAAEEGARPGELPQGSTTANRDRSGTPFRRHRKDAPGRTSPSSRIRMPETHDGHVRKSAMTFQTRSTGASMTSVDEEVSWASGSTRPRAAYSSCSTARDGPE